MPSNNGLHEKRRKVNKYLTQLQIFIKNKKKILNHFFLFSAQKLNLYTS